MGRGRTREGNGKRKDERERGGLTREGQVGREGREGIGGGRTGREREKEGGKSRPTVISRSRRL